MPGISEFIVVAAIGLIPAVIAWLTLRQSFQNLPIVTRGALVGLSLLFSWPGLIVALIVAACSERQMEPLHTTSDGSRGN